MIADGFQCAKAVATVGVIVIEIFTCIIILSQMDYSHSKVKRKKKITHNLMSYFDWLPQDLKILTWHYFYHIKLPFVNELRLVTRDLLTPGSCNARYSLYNGEYPKIKKLYIWMYITEESWAVEYKYRNPPIVFPMIRSDWADTASPFWMADWDGDWGEV
jgi:hypothetical protein